MSTLAQSGTPRATASLPVEFHFALERLSGDMPGHQFPVPQSIEVAEPSVMFDIFAVVFIAIPRTFASVSQYPLVTVLDGRRRALPFFYNRPVLKHLEDHPQYLLSLRDLTWLLSQLPVSRTRS